MVAPTELTGMIICYHCRLFLSFFGIEFFFPSPTLPEEDCPRWLERDKAIRCADYILPTDSGYLPKDIRYRCHRNQESLGKLKKLGYL